MRRPRGLDGLVMRQYDLEKEQNHRLRTWTCVRYRGRLHDLYARSPNLGHCPRLDKKLAVVLSTKVLFFCEIRSCQTSCPSDGCVASSLCRDIRKATK